MTHISYLPIKNDDINIFSKVMSVNINKFQTVDMQFNKTQFDRM